MGTWELFCKVALQPLLGCMMLALGTVSVATGMMDAVCFPAAVALIEAVSIVSALAGLDPRAMLRKLLAQHRTSQYRQNLNIHQFRGKLRRPPQ